MSSADPTTVSEPAFWQGLYERGGDRWELGQPTPTLLEYLTRTPPPRGRVAVLGCGRAHDCRLLVRQGYRVWGFDFAPQAVRAARALAGQDALDLTIEQRDIFDLPEDYAGFFDGIWEYTCFCAIDPARRTEYVELVARLLKPDGWFLACFFPVKEGSGGPPFPATQAEIRRLFAPRFAFVETSVPESSAEGRKGLEWMVRAWLRRE